MRAVRARIAAAAAQHGRNVDSVTLLAVGKGQPVEALGAMATLGVRDFGENYLQEALPKVAALRDRGLTWHFIGQVQSNKTREIALNFDWVHTVDRARIAHRLAEQRSPHASPLQVCIQLRLGDEPGKGGIDAAGAAALAAEIRALPRLALRGVMCVPPPEDEPAAQRRWFAAARRIRDDLQARLGGAPLDTLSMGMSGDLEAAIAEGATVVRVGTALFGPRPGA
ncbi:MAG: YggS family pyridoxal phosphate-dependent enzyme [Steroidobacteraceae bacterium]|nr:YggS family pyridoxal phosphate-dependent enzyme [Steroidobacteraceae bacterium]